MRWHSAIRWPRMTTRSLMIGLVGVAIVLWLARPAVEVHLHKDKHAHVGLIRVPDNEYFSLRNASGHVFGCFMSMGQAAPFWPRYWRRLVGLPSERLAVCSPNPLLVEESCQYARPEIATRQPDGSVQIHFPADIEAAVERERARRAADPRSAIFANARVR